MHSNCDFNSNYMSVWDNPLFWYLHWSVMYGWHFRCAVWSIQHRSECCSFCVLPVSKYATEPLTQIMSGSVRATWYLTFIVMPTLHNCPRTCWNTGQWNRWWACEGRLCSEFLWTRASPGGLLARSWWHPKAGSRVYLRSQSGHQAKFMTLSRIQSRVVTGLLTGHNTLRRHLYLLGLSNSPLCRWCEAVDETLAHVLCECEALASRRHAYLAGLLLSGARGYCES